MNNIPSFFVPDVQEENQEEEYKQLAQSENIPIPQLNERIYSIVFSRGNDVITATVGKSMPGERYIIKAIFPGKQHPTEPMLDKPYVIKTNDPYGMNWRNPVYIDLKKVHNIMLFNI